jgi:hypothetical protein
MIKKTLPLLLGCIAGWILVAEHFLPQPWLAVIRETLLDWGQIVAAAAFVLGGVNLLQVNNPKIRRRETDWQYKVVLLAGAVFMFSFGVRWDKLFGDLQPGTVTVAASEAGADPGRAFLRVEAARPDAVVRVDGGDPRPAASAGGPLVVEVEPGKRQVHVFMTEVGYVELRQEFEVRAGQTATATAALPMTFGLDGRLYTWVYNYVFAPCNATMFALLAFYIASAAFRAFRARNLEAALLLGAGIVLLLGRAPIGRLIHDSLPAIADWIIDVPNNAGRRAIIMGSALGAIVTGLRVILGMERQHLGSE